MLAGIASWDRQYWKSIYCSCLHSVKGQPTGRKCACMLRHGANPLARTTAQHARLSTCSRARPACARSCLHSRLHAAALSATAQNVTVIPRKGDEEKGGVTGVASLAGPRGSAGSAGRLFSNVTPGNMRHTPGTVFGSAALVSGTTVGAGKSCLLLLLWWHPEGTASVVTAQRH